MWHGKWQGMLNYRESPNDKWKRKTKVLRTYHEADPEHIGRKIERQLPEPSGRVTKAMTQLAEVSLREWREELVGRSRINDPNTTVGDYLSFYLDTIEKAKLVEQSTMGPYRCIERFLKKRDIAYIPLQDLCQEDVEKFIADMVEDGYQPGTVRKYYNVLHGAIKHAVSARTLPYDPCIVEDPLYSLSLGHERGALNSDRSMMRAGSWRSLTIATGEIPIVGDNTQQGAANRTLEINAKPFATQREA